MTNDLNDNLGRPDLAQPKLLAFKKRTKLWFIGFAAICLAAITLA